MTHQAHLTALVILGTYLGTILACQLTTVTLTMADATKYAHTPAQAQVCVLAKQATRHLEVRALLLTTVRR